MKRDNPKRLLIYQEDERLHFWLSMLLDAYAEVDLGIEKAIQRHQKDTGAELACQKGCSNCCKTHRDIPIYPLEMVGIYWYVIEKLQNPERSILQSQLACYKGQTECPFLVNASCSIYPLRPISCRQFNVFNRSCEVGEDPYYTRNEEVLKPPKEITDRAFAIMAPFYGVTDRRDIDRFIKKDLMHTHVKILQGLRWDKLALRM